LCKGFSRACAAFVPFALQPTPLMFITFIHYVISLTYLEFRVSLLFLQHHILISPTTQSSLVNSTMEPWRNQLFPWLSAKLVNCENEDLWLGGVLS
jgi:hypothetical protein